MIRRFVMIEVQTIRLVELRWIAVYQGFLRQLRDVLGNEALGVPVLHGDRLLHCRNRLNPPDEFWTWKPRVDLPDEVRAVYSVSS
jgi:hypothetical protein